MEFFIIIKVPRPHEKVFAKDFLISKLFLYDNIPSATDSFDFLTSSFRPPRRDSAKDVLPAGGTLGKQEKQLAKNLPRSRVFYNKQLVCFLFLPNNESATTASP